MPAESTGTVHFVDALPTTSSGKLMRRKLRDLRPDAERPRFETATTNG